MRQRIECSVRVMAPRDVVWSLLQNSARYGEWHALVTEARLVTPAPPRRGARVRVSYKWLVFRSWVDLEYSVWSPPERSTIRSEGRGPWSLFTTLDGSWQLHDNGDGTTGWTTVVLPRLRGGLLGRALVRWFARGYVQRLMERSQQNLKRLIEAEYQPPAQPVAPAPRSALTGNFWQPGADRA